MFFEKYAKEHKFDPLLPDMWYTQQKSTILATKVFFIINIYFWHLHYYFQHLNVYF